jgi:DHA1 family bicyclomycin/chloramphenicol resistance-like MFS transporter
LIPPPVTLRLTVLLGVLFALTALGVDSFQPAMPVIAGAFGAEARLVQLALTTFFLGIAFGQLLWGPLSDRFGRRPALLWGLAAFLASSIACAFAGSVEEIVALRFLQGLGMSSGPVIARSVVRDLFAHEQAARLLSRMMIVFGLVPILAPLAGGTLVALGWQAVFWFLAAVAALLLALVYRNLAETAPAIGSVTAPAELARRFGRLLRDRRFVAPLAVMLCAQSAIVAFVSNAPFALVLAYGLSPTEYAALFATIMLGQIAGAWTSSRLVMKRGIPWMLRAGAWASLGAALALAVLAWSGVGHWAAVLLPMAAFMFASPFIMSNAVAAALSAFPQIAGSASALLGFIQFGTGAAVSAALAALFDGSALPMTVAILLSSIGAVAIERLLYRPRPAWKA